VEPIVSVREVLYVPGMPNQCYWLEALPVASVALSYYLKRKLCLFPVRVVVQCSCTLHRFTAMSELGEDASKSVHINCGERLRQFKSSITV
jgi:hypothetical protein